MSIRGFLGTEWDVAYGLGSNQNTLKMEGLFWVRVAYFYQNQVTTGELGRNLKTVYIYLHTVCHLEWESFFKKNIFWIKLIIMQLMMNYAKSDFHFKTFRNTYYIAKHFSISNITKGFNLQQHLVLMAYMKESDITLQSC